MDEISLHGAAVYNPGLWSREELKRYFVARMETLDRIVDDLRRERPGSSPQHRLILGLRGMGKSTLLRRIAIAVDEDKELAGQWLPLTFPEEQYNVASLCDLWTNCLDALGDALEEKGSREKAARLDAAIEKLAPNDGGQALELLLAEAESLDLRLLLLIDNIDLVLERLKADHWSLREILQSESQLMIIGASSKAIEASYKYDAAFYDFFKIDELKGLSEKEMRATLTRLAEQGHTPHVIQLMEDDPARIKTLHTLTGGNPRTIVLLYNVLARGLDGDVRSDLEGLLDLVTPLYKARFEELPEQEQQLVDGLAVNWDPMTARQLAQKLRWDVNKTSSLLNRLQQQAVVEKVKPAEGKRAAFQIGERFFNIWYLMRASRRVRRKLIWLVHFLRMFFTSRELRDHARSKVLQKGSCSRDAEYNMALAQVVDSGPLRAALEHNFLHTLFDVQSTRDEIDTLLDLQGEDAELLPKVERIRALRDIGETISQALDKKNLSFDKERFVFILLGSLALSLEDKQGIANQADTLSASQWQDLQSTITEEYQKYTKICLKDPRVLYEAIGQGVMVSRYDIEGAEAAVLQYNAPWLLAFAWFWWIWMKKKSSLQQIPQMEEVYNEAIELNPENAFPWFCLGIMLRYHPKRYKEAEKALRKAIDLAPEFAIPYSSLAWFFYEQQEKLAEAITLAQKGVDLAGGDNLHAIHTLATLLLNQGRWQEAEPHMHKLITNGSEEFFDAIWDDMIILFKEAVAAGRAKDALQLLDSTAAAEHWRPLREALAAAAAGDSQLLNGVAPEIRAISLQILTDIAPDIQVDTLER